MRIEEYKEFVKDGNPFVKLETITNEAYVMYIKNLGEATDGCFAVCTGPCCYLYTDRRGHKHFNLRNNSCLYLSIPDISRASECEIRELYKHFKKYEEENQNYFSYSIK